MKKLNLLILMLSALFLFSCEKNDDITVSINESGSLEMKIIDNNNQPVENAKIILIDLNTESILFEDEIDSSGIYKLDRILQGSYRCFISTEKEGREYTMTSYFQVFTNNKKIVEYNPFANVGNVNVSVKISGAVGDITKYMVAIVPENYASNDINLVKKYAYYSSNLDNEGNAKITDIPADKNYRVYIYKDNAIYTSSYFFMSKKVEKNIACSFSVGSLNLTVNGEIANYNEYDVIITPYSSYDNNIDYIKENTLYSGKLDSNGKISFKELLKIDYNVYLIKNDIIYNYRNFYFNNQQNSIDVSLNVGSISVKVEGSVSNPTSYSIALSRSYCSNVQEIKSSSLIIGKLDSNNNVKFTELPVINYNGSIYIHMYKDNEIYGRDWFYPNWDNSNQSITMYVY